jgi:hypothetical protein
LVWQAGQLHPRFALSISLRMTSASWLVQSTSGTAHVIEYDRRVPAHIGMATI